MESEESPGDLDDLLDGLSLPEPATTPGAEDAPAKRGRGRPKGTKDTEPRAKPMSKMARQRWLRDQKKKQKVGRPKNPLTAEFLLTGEGVPWDDLPDSSDFTADVRWVANTYKVVVSEKPGCPVVINWKKANRPPSKLAVSLMEVAAANRQKFFFDIALKVLLDEKTGEDGPEVIQEKIDIEEIKKQLAKLVEANEVAAGMTT